MLVGFMVCLPLIGSLLVCRLCLVGVGFLLLLESCVGYECFCSACGVVWVGLVILVVDCIGLGCLLTCFPAR